MNIHDEYDKLLRYCYMKIHDKFFAEDVVAEDIVLESFVKYYSHSIKSESNAYSYPIARNLCIDNYRKYIPDLEECINDAVNDEYDNLEVEEALN